MYYNLICILYALLCGQNFILLKNGCYNKAIVIENKIKEMEKDGKRKVSSSGQSSRSNVGPRFSQPN
jgi:hypothetical protein